MKKLINAVEQYKSFILEAEEYLRKHPETGFKEYENSAYLAARFQELGYSLVYAEGITGFYAVYDTGKPGPEVLVLAELDALTCPLHKDANKQTGAAHACGHHAQCAALLGVAAALKSAGERAPICGRVRLCVVPAEEFLEIEYRQKLRKDGKIKYLNGKTEFLSRGMFNGVDLAFMVHTGNSFCAERGSIGFLSKRIIYKGVSAHAGGAPHLGKNALYAANCGLNAVNALRETFCEKDLIRWHPILTAGGTAVNVIPETAVIESQLRGASFEAIERENEKINRALCGAAVSFGVGIEIEDEPGYAPYENNAQLLSVAKEALAEIKEEEPFGYYDGYATGSTDVGDLACIMPVLMVYCGGASGRAHAADYEITSPILACVESAKWQLAMLGLLLKEQGERAKEIVKNYQPQYATKEEYLQSLDRRRSVREPIAYLPNGEIIVKK
ncbi:MAG: amidohydrolase [Clostridia bacterium]|nr:amidohydrolase [Clostridia bacterium]